MKSDHYLPQVRAQYEELPYPPRDPADEKTRLVRTWLDDLAMINHYCYAGRQTFQDRFRVLVAGGGTGDSTIFLAEQLRHTNAEIVHLDLSQAAIEIARQRARMVGLDNITWVHESLLALPGRGLGQFDYINCIGVLNCMHAVMPAIRRTSSKPYRWKIVPVPLAQVANVEKKAPRKASR